MEITPVRALTAATMSVPLLSSSAVEGYAGLPSKKYASKFERSALVDSRITTMIFSRLPPMSPQSATAPEKMSRTCMRVRSVTGFAAFTITPVPLTPTGTRPTLSRSSGGGGALLVARSTSPVAARRIPAADPTSLKVNRTVGCCLRNSSLSAVKTSSGAPPPFTTYVPARGSGAALGATVRDAQAVSNSADSVPATTMARWAAMEASCHAARPRQSAVCITRIQERTTKSGRRGAPRSKALPRTGDPGLAFGCVGLVRQRSINCVDRAGAFVGVDGDRPRHRVPVLGAVVLHDELRLSARGAEAAEAVGTRGRG